MKGGEVRRLRRRLGLTQQQLADKLGVTKNTVYRWEKELMGIREPSARLIRLLAKMEGKEKRKRRGS